MPTAWNNLGIVHADQGRSADAADCFRRAVTIKPDFADGWFNLGKALPAHVASEARGIEDLSLRVLRGDQDFVPARLTVDMFRLPNIMAPIEVKTRTIREEDVSFNLPKELRSLTLVN